MSVTRFEEVGGYARHEGEWVEPSLVEKPQGWLVKYSDYEKLVTALREIRKWAPMDSLVEDLAQAALLSAREWFCGFMGIGLYIVLCLGEAVKQ